MMTRYLMIVCCVLVSLPGYGQNKKASPQPKLPGANSIGGVIDNDRYCNALMQVIADAGFNFEHIRGKEIEYTNKGVIFSVNMGVPGTSASSVYIDSASRYEGVVYQGKSAEEMAAAYGGFKKKMTVCLTGHGYQNSETMNAEKKLEKFPDTWYTLPGKTGTAGAGIQVALSEINGIYTVTMFVIK